MKRVWEFMKGNHPCANLAPYRHLRARRALSIFKDVMLRTRRALSLYNVYGDSALLLLNGISLNSDSALLALKWRYWKGVISHSKVLVDSNEFSLIFWKVQHSHSRHQKTTSHLLRINLKGKVRFNNKWPLEGAMYINLRSNFRGHPEMLVFFLQFTQNIDVSDKSIHKAFRIHKTL